MKPNKLDSQFYPAKHVIIKTQGRDTFTLVNVATQATLIRNAKYLKHAAKPEVVDTSMDEQNDRSDSTSINTSETSQESPDAGNESEPSHDITQANQSEASVTTRSGHTVISTKDPDTFVYY